MRRQTASATLFIFTSLFLLPLAAPPRAAAKTTRARAEARGTQKRSPEFRFDTDRAALRIPFELYANVILLRARVNNSAPLWFLLDTGASGSLIDSRHARRLGLRRLGAADIKGMGGSVAGAYMGGANFGLPGVRVFDRKVFSMPLSPLFARFGRRVDGVIGYDFFKLFVVEVDYAAKTINLYDPRSYEYKGAGEVVPSRATSRLTPAPTAHSASTARSPKSTRCSNSFPTRPPRRRARARAARPPTSRAA
jgi:Aspartyl protease